MAIFLPELGMHTVSFMYGEVELIDQSTKASFEKRFAGLANWTQGGNYFCIPLDALG